MATLPQPPAMAYAPRRDHGWPIGPMSLYDPHAPSYQQTGPSPFSPGLPSSATSSPGLEKRSSFDSPILGKALSNSSYPSSLSSPARSSYHAGVHRQMRDSCHSHRSSNSHYSRNSVLVSPRPLNPIEDAEKQAFQSRPLTSPSPRTKSQGYTISARAGDRDGVDEVVLERKALEVLIYLCAFNSFVAFLILLYTIFALLLIALLQPFRLIAKRQTFRQQVIDFLSPTLKIQLAFVYSTAATTDYSVPILILVQVLAPVVSIGVAMAAWVAGAFWFFNAILGDPAGEDKHRGYNDGRASVIGVRRWWERWLTRALR